MTVSERQKDAVLKSSRLSVPKWKAGLRRRASTAATPFLSSRRRCAVVKSRMQVNSFSFLLLFFLLGVCVGLSGCISMNMVEGIDSVVVVYPSLLSYLAVKTFWKRRKKNQGKRICQGKNKQIGKGGKKSSVRVISRGLHPPLK